MERKHALDGVKIVDFGWIVVGPASVAELAWHGATVVRVETHRRPDLLRMGAPFKEGRPGIDRSAVFASANPNKYGISLDISMPKGKEVAQRLIKWADIVAEGYVPL